jgi:ribosomal protein S18 acetylase RimI-like enzyme
MTRSEDFADAASYGNFTFHADEPGTYGSSIIARATSKSGQPGKRVGVLSWYGRGDIAQAYVSKQFRRKGIASAMLDYARAKYPDKNIHHSPALSPDGAAWAESHP